MNIVLCLSRPLDLSPIYKSPVPLELLNTGNSSLYDSNYSLWRKFFPDASFYVIDCGPRPVFSELSGNADSLNIPSASLFSKTFLFSTFSGAFSLSPVTLFVPANLQSKILDKLCLKIRKVLKNPVSSDSFTFFSSREGNHSHSIEKGDQLFLEKEFELYSIKKFTPLTTTLLWKEKHPDAKESPYLSGNSVFLMNTFRFKDFLSSADEELYELFHLIENSWKDRSSLQNILADAVQLLDSFSFEEMIVKMEDRFVTPFEGGFEEINTFSRLLKTLPRNDHGNFISGSAEVSDVTDSLILNYSNKRIVLNRLKNILALSSNNGTRIESL